MPTLIVLQGGEALPYPLSGDEAVIGRLPECHLQLNSNMVSRKHARVVRAGDKWLMEDLGSGNGTLVNGKKIEQPVELHHEDRIKIGPILLRFEAPEAASGRVRPHDRISAAIAGGADLGSTMGVDFMSGEDDSSTIMSTGARGVGMFGQLEVQPEAKLKGVLEISRSLAGTVDLELILPRILDTLFTIFPHADRGCVLLRQEETGKMIPRAMKHRRAGDDETVKLSRTILKTVMEQKTGVLSADATNDARFEASESISTDFL
jgi:hypothetical protein